MRVTTAYLIPARGGSVRIPRKNLEKVAGVTLVGRAVRCANSDFGLVVVATDDDDIAREALRCEATVMRRPHSEANEPMISVLDWFVRRVTCDAVAVLQPTTPLRCGYAVDACVHAVEAGAKTAVTVDPDTMRRTGGAYVARREWILATPATDPDELWGDAVLVPAPDDGPDINTPEDLSRARVEQARRDA